MNSGRISISLTSGERPDARDRSLCDAVLAESPRAAGEQTIDAYAERPTSARAAGPPGVSSAPIIQPDEPKMAPSNALEIRDPRSQEFLDCWQAFRKGDAIPAWADFSPGELGHLLPNLTVLEWTGPEYLSYRFAGQGIVDRIGVDITGSNFLDLITAEARAFILARGVKILSYPCGFVSLMEELYASGETRRTENVILPVRPRGEGPDLMVVHTAQVEGLPHTAEDGRREQLRLLSLAPLDVGAGIPADADLGPLGGAVNNPVTSLSS